MRIKLHINKSVHENAAAYYELAKEARKKREGLAAAMEETRKEIDAAKKKQKEGEKKAVRVKREKQWFEKFHWFTTSGGRLAVGGRDAKQNDLLFAKHMDEADLFFHADIQGGSAVILKDGADAGQEELLECAQFAASLSNAWKNANAGVDVYAVKKGQLSKHSHGGYIPSGAFAITGERAWFRSTRLGVRAGIGEGSKRAELVPAVSKRKLLMETALLPSRSGRDKGALAKILAKKLNVHPDELLEILPNGKSKIAEK